MKKVINNKLAILFAILWIVTLIIFMILFNKTEIIKISNNKAEQLTSSGNDYIKTSEHLAQMEGSETELANFKSAIASAITTNGVATAPTDTLDTMVSNIASISKTRIIKLGQGTSFNVSGYEGYQNFTTANFLIESSCGNVSSTNTSGYTWGIQGTYNGLRFSKSYNKDTGALKITVSAPSLSMMINQGDDTPGGIWKAYNPSYSYNVYLVY